MNSSDIDWNDVIEKEARGINDEDLGEVQEDYFLISRRSDFSEHL